MLKNFSHLDQSGVKTIEAYIFLQILSIRTTIIAGGLGWPFYQETKLM
jgi:hypothetical protein